MRMKSLKTTRLTEMQARALADWWGGCYERLNPEKSGEVWHGVSFRQLHRKDPSSPQSPGLAVFSLEEARALENLREAVNPASPDWVG
jgi:hypothetical protein